MELKEILALLLQKITDLEKKLGPMRPGEPVTENWIRGDDLKAWLNYGATQFCEFLQTEGLVVRQIGRRKFVLRKSLEQLLERSILKG